MLDGFVTPVSVIVVGVAAVKVTVLVVSLTPRLEPIVVSVQLPPAEAPEKLGVSVPAVAVQLSPMIGLLSQKSIKTSGLVMVVAGVKVTVYVTLVALGAEELMVMLRVVTCPFADAAPRNKSGAATVDNASNVAPNA